MITIISYKAAVLLSEYSEKKDEVDFLRYGIEILLGGFIKIIVLFLTAGILGVFQPMVWVFFTFALFRSLTGGHHYSTYRRCLIAGLVIMTGTSCIASYAAEFIPSDVLLSMLCGSAAMGFYFAYIYAPSNHFYKKSTDKQKEKLRKYSFLMILAWSFLMYILLLTNYSSVLILASILGFSFQMGSIHPYTYKIVNTIETFLNRGLTK
ncbi:accessory gene regulator B family protein [Domibacillus epiphyticus]|uniref:Accessory regulator AgrB n=1 Tax=Domibacillus epiphyticus TaxID=1714355 RepID=A0A1V2A685_9BACI|nr:accessory gene regulator B family protein [Domibacillus epiphyticus]OMP66440.1 hypothetical protein BTO28_12110 [Domibacillus epiphyticus]